VGLCGWYSSCTVGRSRMWRISQVAGGFWARWNLYYGVSGYDYFVGDSFSKARSVTYQGGQVITEPDALEICITEQGNDPGIPDHGGHGWVPHRSSVARNIQATMIDEPADSSPGGEY
jgi:hypothetical protein